MGELRCLTEPMFEEAEESATGGFEGALLLLRIAVIQQWSSLLQNVEEQIFDWHFSESRGFVQVADDFSSQHPKVVNVLADGFSPSSSRSGRKIV